VKITIKQISGIIACNAILIGLAACSSSPAPWTRPDESPWSDKHAAAEQAAPVGDIIADEPAPVMESEPMTEPEPMAEPESEPAMMAEPEPEPVAMPSTPEEEVMAMDGKSFAVQVTAMKDIPSMKRYQSRFGLEHLSVVKTDRNGSVIYVLLSLQPDRASANQAASELELKTGTKPWVRSIAGLQKIVVQ
jgi:septal ring-binding cell division protein DamX